MPPSHLAALLTLCRMGWGADSMPLRALLISTLRLFAWYLPMLWLGSQLGGLPGLMTGALIGNLLAGTSAYLLYRQGMTHLRQTA